MWNLIPHMFYDLLARVVPGAILIIVTAFVIAGHDTMNTFIANLSYSSGAYIVVLFVLWTLGAYLGGILLGQFWEITAGILMKKVYKNIEAKCKQRCLEEHNKLQKLLTHPKLDIKTIDLPSVYVMHDHLRHIAPSEATRLLKLRAEAGSFQALFLGFCFLSIVNGRYLMIQGGTTRMAWEIFLIIAIIACLVGMMKLHKYFVNGTTVSWLIFFNKIGV